MKNTQHRPISKRPRKSARRPAKSIRMSKSARARFIANMLFKISMLSMQKNQVQLEQTIFSSFTQLGGIYIKFLQLVVLKTRFFSHLTVTQKMAVYDAVTADPVDINLFLTRELGPNYDKQIVQCDTTPFACGSFGQVYFARHASGQHLIVKVLRPSITANLKSDLRTIGIIVNLLRNHFKIATDVGSFYRDFRAVVLRETDYTLEIQNALFFHEYFANSRHIVIPKTYTELSTNQVIVQDYIHGLPMTQLIMARDTGKDPAEYVQQTLGSDLHQQMEVLGRELIKSIFVADKIFGDPHPGNLILLPQNQVGIVDFGIAGVPPIDRKAFMILMEDVVGICNGEFDPGITFINGMRYFTPDLYRAINSLSGLLTTDQYTSSDVMMEIRKAAQSALNTSAKQVDIETLMKTGRVSTIMNRVVNDGNKFSLNVVMDAGTIVTLRTADGYISLLEALNLVDSHIPHVIKQAIDEVKSESFVLKGRGETMDFEMAVNVISDWMQSLIESDPMFFAPLIKQLRQAMSARQMRAPETNA